MIASLHRYDILPLRGGPSYLDGLFHSFRARVPKKERVQ